MLSTKTVDFVEDVRDVLEKEANAILALSTTIGDDINRALEMLLSCEGRVVITGMGKSGIIGRKINATLASTGTPSLFLHPSEGLHGDLGMVTKHDVVIAISNSGETDEVLSLLPSIQKIGSKMIAIVKNTDSTLGNKSDIALSIGQAEEACPLGLAPTTSTTVTLALGDALAVALLKARKFGPSDFALFHPSGSLGRRLLMTAKDVVNTSNKNPMVSPGTTIQEALFLMTAQGLGATSVVDETNTLLGILTDGDIRRALTASQDILSSTVFDLYNPSPVVIEEHALAAEALKVMEEKKVNVLPVVNEYNKPIGMVHIQDLVNLGL
ncbi:KpsF/GutQ family sugar-phosphate isomerase [Rossellomorea marisflavi]|uniref:KpsF/GutQ family sugar-phosphate isomerase n=1 Tax=Rossellomorea marisflavi TaxID=189381 RepID=UPI0028531961|nr:KpsF/GutQ family sugar-phosphate isomerase [Rossellomorea marisflavi]MDR4935296.1 KpsF/GutQ family sugar-phosphate isomerase [Rossellomorea marisflavi]